MKTLWSCVAIFILTTTGSFVKADEESASKSSNSRSVQVTINKSTTQTSDDSAPKATVSGRFVIQSPDGTVKEFELGDTLPQALDVSTLLSVTPLKIESLADIAADAEPRVVIGVACEPADAALRSHLKLDDRGLLVTGVADGLPAQTVGIMKHDILLQIKDTTLRTLQDLVTTVSESEGQELEITLLRTGDEQKVRVIPVRKAGTEVAAAMKKGGMVPPSVDQEMKVLIRKFPNGMKWVMGPGILLENGTDDDATRVISEARKNALKGLQDVRKNDEELRREVSQLREQVVEMQKQLKALQSK